MAHMNLDTVEGAARLLADVEMTVRGQRAGDWSKDNTRWLVTLTCGGDSIDTSFEWNTRRGEPALIDVLQTHASEAADVVYQHIDDYADEMGFTKPSQAIAAYEACKKGLAWLNDIGVDKDEVATLAATLDDERDEVQEQAQAIRVERAAKEAYENPYVPEGFRSIKDLEEDLDLGDYGDRCADYSSEDYLDDVLSEVADSYVDIYDHDLLEWLPGHYEWFETAVDESGFNGGLMQMIQAAQRECYESDLSEHREDIAKYVTLESLKDEGVYAVSEEVADALMYDIDYSRTDRLSFLLDEAKEQMQSIMAANLTETLGDEDRAEEVAEELVSSGDYTANPCALSADGMREANKRGLDGVIADRWKDGHGDEMSLASVAEECRAVAHGHSGSDSGPGHDDPNR